MKVYIETYGCRMNICDSEVILSILSSSGHVHVKDIKQADVIILNCCSVREIGHERTFERLSSLAMEGLNERKIVVAGCFATQLDKCVFDTFPFIDIVIGPDSYRKLPLLLKIDNGSNVIVKESFPGEMYSDIVPVRDIEDKTTAAITVMKGCNQYCSYCIEPYTRGKESSRDIQSIIAESLRIQDKGYKELTLVGHIIDRYEYGFATLLDHVAKACPGLRVKFLSSHPSTFSDEIAGVIAKNKNIMRVVHLPLQSGSDEVLARMSRGYKVSDFKNRIRRIREIVPDIKIITDIMTGFCGETESDFQDTLRIIEELRFDDINAFCFSMRKGTSASKRYVDDVPEEIKRKRYEEVISLRDSIRVKKYETEIGHTIKVFNEGSWDKNPSLSYGRDYYLRTITYQDNPGIPINQEVKVKVLSVDANSLFGEIVEQ